jgi:hypothetical protein
MKPDAVYVPVMSATTWLTMCSELFSTLWQNMENPTEATRITKNCCVAAVMIVLGCTDPEKLDANMTRFDDVCGRMIQEWVDAGLSVDDWVFLVAFANRLAQEMGEACELRTG